VPGTNRVEQIRLQEMRRPDNTEQHRQPVDGFTFKPAW